MMNIEDLKDNLYNVIRERNVIIDNLYNLNREKNVIINSLIENSKSQTITCKVLLKKLKILQTKLDDIKTLNLN